MATAPAHVHECAEALSLRATTSGTSATVAVTSPTRFVSEQ
jgi:hypothetical protein